MTLHLHLIKPVFQGTGISNKGVLGAGTAQNRDSTRKVSGAGQIKGGPYHGTYMYWKYMRDPPPPPQ